MNSVNFSNNLMFKKVLLSHICNRLMATGEQYTHMTFNNCIREIKLCNAKTRNSLSIPMMETLIENITREQDNPDLRVIVITSLGPVFSAGHNLKELAPNCNRSQHQQVFRLASILMKCIIDSPVPVIARVDGLAAAAGCQLVAQCDLAVCTEKSTFSTPGANFGIFCSTPGIALGRSVNKNTAMYMLLTGLPLTSHEAKESGLVNKICSPETVDMEVNNICKAIIGKSRSVVELGKRFFYKQMQTDIKSAYDISAKIMLDNVEMEDGQEGIKSFIEKRKPPSNKLVYFSVGLNAEGKALQILDRMNHISFAAGESRPQWPLFIVKFIISEIGHVIAMFAY